jgi:predicted TIM-barrel fold metal-dependent hydrolase
LIIDVSNVIGRHKFKPEITAESLLKQMDAAGVDKAVISCYAESLDNESVYNAIRKYPDRFIGLYTVNPWADNSAAELEDALKNKGFKGLYMHPVRHGYMLCEHEVFYPLLEVCRKYKAVVWCYGAAEVVPLLRLYPRDLLRRNPACDRGILRYSHKYNYCQWFQLEQIMLLSIFASSISSNSDSTL